MSKDLSPLAKRRLHMIRLLLRLPEAGVAGTWPTERACRNRLIATRWQDGVRCPKCENAIVGFLKTRQNFYCKSCLLQFSAQSHSIFHRSHVNLLSWFRAAELLIRYNAHHPDLNYPTGHDLRDVLGISYAAAHALKRKSLSELLQPDGGLLGRCVAVGSAVSAPSNVPVGSSEELLWFYHRIAN